MNDNAHPPPLQAQSDNRNYWLCQFFGWGTKAVATGMAATNLFILGVAVIVAAPNDPQSEMWTSWTPVPWPRALAESLLLHGIALFATHRLRSHLKLYGWLRLPGWALFRRALLAALLLGIPLGILHQQLAIAVINSSFTAESLNYFNQIANWWLTFALWLGLYIVIVKARERRYAAQHQAEMKQALQAAELALLKSQLNPHFLFNSLNSVRALIADDPAAAQQAITKLSRTLRYTLGAGERDLVSLREELIMVEDYLELESLRLGERLQIRKSIPAALLDKQIPVMLLQTVVENAIKHGIAELPTGGELRIRADTLHDTLMLNITNPSPIHISPAAGEGIGLSNGAERLRLLFGDAAGLDLDLSTPGMAHTTLRIPQNDESPADR